MAKAKYLKFQDSEVLVDYANKSKSSVSASTDNEGKSFTQDYCKRLVLTGNYIGQYASNKSFTEEINESLISKDGQVISEFLKMEDPTKKSYSIIYLKESNWNLLIRQYDQDSIYAVATTPVSENIDSRRDIESYISFEISISKTKIKITPKPEKAYISLLNMQEGDIDVYVDVLKPDTITYYYASSSSKKYEILTYQTSVYKNSLLYLYYANEEYILQIDISDCFNATPGTYTGEIKKRKKLYRHDVWINRYWSNQGSYWLDVIENPEGNPLKCALYNMQFTLYSTSNKSISSVSTLMEVCQNSNINFRTHTQATGILNVKMTSYYIPAFISHMSADDTTSSSEFNLHFFGTFLRPSSDPLLGFEEWEARLAIPYNSLQKLTFNDNVTEIGYAPFKI